MESTVLGSRYELLERIGMGGMAVVYKAKDKMLNRFVAVKILREEFKENEDFIRRFKIESQAAASLSHQNIVQIYDVGEENGMHYIVMEFLEGDTLKKHIIDNKGHLSRREAVNYSMQICRALEHAHSKYVVHRDIKPQNIVITESGKLKVTDFGIARAANNTTTVNDKSTIAVGSAHYLSPEQARGGYTDHRSDIYSFGVVMYELFCGKLPFDAEESVAVLMQHLQEEPVRPREINPDLPEGIEAIILKAMKKEQRLRYRNATEILEDLVSVYQNPSIDVSLLNASTTESGTHVEKKSTSSRQPRPASDKSKSSHSRKRRRKKRSSKTIIAVLSLIVVILALIGWGIKAFLDLLDTGDPVEVPDLIGMNYEEADMEVRQASTDDVVFTIEVSEEYSDEEAGTIISQTPEGGGTVKSDRTIKVVISKGPVVITLKDYSDQPFDKVEKELEQLGIKVIKEEVTDPDGKEGYIFKQNPQEGTSLAKGEAVTLFVYVKGENVIVPNVIGMNADDAINLLTEQKLEVGNISDDNESNLPEGQVSYQSKNPKSRVSAYTTIDLKVSTGKNQTPENEDAEEDEDKAEEQNQEKDNKEESTEEKDENPENEGNVDSTTQEDPDDKNSNSEVLSTKTFSINLSGLPKSKETVRIKLVHDGKTYYEKDFPTSSGSAVIPIETDKSLSLDVYYDGTYITTKEVKY